MASTCRSPSGPECIWQTVSILIGRWHCPVHCGCCTNESWLARRCPLVRFDVMPPCIVVLVGGIKRKMKQTQQDKTIGELNIWNSTSTTAQPLQKRYLITSAHTNTLHGNISHKIKMMIKILFKQMPKYIKHSQRLTNTYKTLISSLCSNKFNPGKMFSRFEKWQCLICNTNHCKPWN